MTTASDRADNISKSQMKKYELLVFLTGALTLSLEVLASRIMTPYFGVSLYIWSGILSITLVFLAFGYRAGGIVAAKLPASATEYLFLATPIASAFAILVSALLYPFAFPFLSQANLILGSFVGATLLLALPLIGLSAMNPLLISLMRSKADTGDAGAGRVFFISTMGSVAGVLVTAFLFIPNVTNFRSVLALALGISLITALYALAARNLTPKKKRLLIGISLVVAILCGGLIMAKKSFLKTVNSVFSHQLVFEIEAEYTSMFGNIKVAIAQNKDGSGPKEKYFLQDGLVQNRTDMNNTSISMYTYVLQSLVDAYVPKAKDVVVLGLGAGIVPRHFSDDGRQVSVVEINSQALRAARENFGFNDKEVKIYLEDARTFVRKCDRAYDAAVVDLFLGDNVPDYLMTKEFFADLRRCIRSDGAMVMNLFLDPENDEPNKRLLATIASAFSNIYVSGIPGQNVFLVGTSVAAPATIEVERAGLPKEIAQQVEYSATNGQQIIRETLRFTPPISDNHNVFSLLFAEANMKERQFLAQYLPPNVLVN